jgi:hypothetical protein
VVLAAILMAVLAAAFWESVFPSEGSELPPASGDSALGGDVPVAVQERAATDSSSHRDQREIVSDDADSDPPRTPFPQSAYGREPLAQVYGSYSFPFSMDRLGAEIVLEARGSSHRRRLVKLSAEDRQVIDATVVYAWQASQLVPGEYVIMYDGVLAQDCTLKSGGNTVFADAQERSAVELLFVDAVSGHPVAADNVKVVSMTSAMEPTAACFVNLDGRRVFTDPGEFLRVDDPLSDWLLIMASAPGHGVCFQVVDAYPGAVHAIELPPSVRMELSLLDPRGGSVERIAPEWASAMRLIVHGKEYKPVISGTRGGVLFAEFPGVTAKAGQWDLRLPDGIETSDGLNQALSPGLILPLRAVYYSG